MVRGLVTPTPLAASVTWPTSIGTILTFSLDPFQALRTVCPSFATQFLEIYNFSLFCPLRSFVSLFHVLFGDYR